MCRFIRGGFENRRKIHLVDWHYVTSPYDRGGLGISSDLTKMNATLIMKWIYQYVYQTEFLQRRIVYAKSGADPQIISFNVSRIGKRSTLINLVDSLLGGNDHAFSMVDQGFRILIGNGPIADFWTNN